MEKVKNDYWVARDKNGELFLYLGKPARNDYEFYSGGALGDSICRLDEYGDGFSDVTWENSPCRLIAEIGIAETPISVRGGCVQSLLHRIQDALWTFKKTEFDIDVTPLIAHCMFIFVFGIMQTWKSTARNKKEAKKYLLAEFDKWWEFWK